MRSQSQMTSRLGTEMLQIKSQMPQAIRLIQVPEISVGEVKAAMEQAPMIYPGRSLSTGAGRTEPESAETDP